MLVVYSGVGTSCDGFRSLLREVAIYESESELEWDGRMKVAVIIRMD